MTEQVRDGDQALPIPNKNPFIQELVVSDIRYGTGLQAHNGRDALRDAYEEALDLTCYLRQCIYERDHPA